jgi:prepilin-type N-terminal cleavage/methylation domain-containing protein
MLKKKPNSGFTIIEVVIVLAIVGLIMVIVFIAVPSHSFIYTYSGNDVEHYIYPATGQVLLGMNHWCYATTGYDPAGNGPTNGPPLAGINGDNADDKFAILIYQERGGFYCLDNYAKH